MNDPQNYAEQTIAALTRALADCEPELIRLYALLVLVRGDRTSLQDVHDAWAIWRTVTRPDHPAIIPFDKLHPATQELDRPYMEAIRAASREASAGER